MSDYFAMATSDPEALLAIDEAGPPETLTYVAEALGRVDDPRSLAKLVRLVRHSSPVVREGAAYGLERHRHRQGVTDLLYALVWLDESQGVQRAASEALE